MCAVNDVQRREGPRRARHRLHLRLPLQVVTGTLSKSAPSRTRTACGFSQRINILYVSSCPKWRSCPRTGDVLDTFSGNLSKAVWPKALSLLCITNNKYNTDIFQALILANVQMCLNYPHLSLYSFSHCLISILWPFLFTHSPLLSDFVWAGTFYLDHIHLDPYVHTLLLFFDFFFSVSPINRLLDTYSLLSGNDVCTPEEGRKTKKPVKSRKTQQLYVR